MANKALQGAKVVEYANGIGTPFCTKILADMGAEVIKIEHPLTGDTARHIGPFAGGSPDPEKSILFFYTNTNKKSITLDLNSDEGIEIFKKIIKDADILVKEGQPEECEKKGLGYETLKELNPGLIVASVTPYGESGPCKDYKAYPLNISQFSGAGSLYPQGTQDLTRPPIMLGGNFEEFDAGVVAAIGVLGALFRKKRTGKGQYIELSSLEARLKIANTENTVYAVYGHSENRTGIRLKMMASLVAPCKDGYIVPYLIQPDEHLRLAILIGKPEWVDEPWYQNMQERIKRIDEVTAAFHDWMKDKTMDEITRLAQEARVPLGPVSSPKDVVESEQFNAREFFTEVEHPVLGKVKFPGRPFIMSETPFSYDHAAPLLGQDNEDVYCKMLGYSKEYLSELKAANVI